MELKFTLDKIKETARQFWSLNSGKSVFAFKGEMGAGKTTFIHALCDVKGVKDIVGSPTFSLINEYEYNDDGEIKKIFHIDLYRIRDEAEAVRAGIEDCLYSGDLCFVEWPEKAPAIFPDGAIHVSFRVLDGQTRMIRIGDI